MTTYDVPASIMNLPGTVPAFSGVKTEWPLLATIPGGWPDAPNLSSTFLPRINASATLDTPGEMILQLYADLLCTIGAGPPIRQWLQAGVAGTIYVRPETVYKSYQLSFRNTTDQTATLSDVSVVQADE